MCRRGLLQSSFGEACAFVSVFNSAGVAFDSKDYQRIVFDLKRPAHSLVHLLIQMYFIVPGTSLEPEPLSCRTSLYRIYY